MDEVIFEEFKGTGNMELRLSRHLADKRIYPAVDVNPSGTRREEVLLAPDELRIMWQLRRVLTALDSQQAIELLLDRLKKSRSNIGVPAHRCGKTAPAGTGTTPETIRWPVRHTGDAQAPVHVRTADDPAAVTRRGDDMKPDIHPEYVETTVTCTCGNTFTTRSTATSGVDQRRRLQPVPPVLHGQAEAARHRWPRRPLPEALRHQAGRDARPADAAK